MIGLNAILLWGLYKTSEYSVYNCNWIPYKRTWIFINHNVNCRRLQIDEIFVESDNSNESIDRLPEIVHFLTRINNLQTNSQSSNDENNYSTSNKIDPSSQDVNAEQGNVHARIENPDQERNMFGGFLDWSQTSIEYQLHSTVLIGVLQLAYGSKDGVLATLGHNNRTRWINQNIIEFF